MNWRRQALVCLTPLFFGCAEWKISGERSLCIGICLREDLRHEVREPEKEKHPEQDADKKDHRPRN